MKLMGRVKPSDVSSQMPEVPVKSHFHLMLDDLRVAYDRMEHVAQLCSSLMLSATRGANFIKQMREDLTAALEETGVAIESNIEQEIAEFIPKHVKASNEEH